MEETKVYKVVYVDEIKNKFYSSNARRGFNGSVVEYQLDKESFPPKGYGPLLAFKDLKSAQFFRSMKEFTTRGKESILECKAILSKEQLPFINLDITEEGLSNFHSKKWTEEEFSNSWLEEEIKIHPILSGTVWCDSITPISVVED